MNDQPLAEPPKDTFGAEKQQVINGVVSPPPKDNFAVTKEFTPNQVVSYSDMQHKRDKRKRRLKGLAIFTALCATLTLAVMYGLPYYRSLNNSQEPVTKSLTTYKTLSGDTFEVKYPSSSSMSTASSAPTTKAGQDYIQAETPLMVAIIDSASKIALVFGVQRLEKPVDPCADGYYSVINKSVDNDVLVCPVQKNSVGRPVAYLAHYSVNGQKYIALLGVEIDAEQAAIDPKYAAEVLIKSDLRRYSTDIAEVLGSIRKL